MEKLELKYLAPYLPYGILVGDGRTPFELTEFNFCNVYPYITQIYLRPLSDIKQFEDIMDEFSEYSWDAFENHFFCDLLGRSLNCFDVVNYTIMELCFKHHLDIFGLIDKGLAVSYSDMQSLSNGK
jgi:hypothetical protein